MNLSRTLVLLPLAALAACGSSNAVPSASEAHTMACRGYVLTVGNSDTEHVTQLIQLVPYSGSDIGSDPVLVKVRSAAATAGTTAGLSEADFTRFRKLVEVIDGLPAKAKAQDDGTDNLPASALTPLLTAASAVHKLCS